MVVSVNNAMLDSNRDGRESHATSHRRLRANEKGGEEDSGGGVPRPADYSNTATGNSGWAQMTGLPPKPAHSASLPPMRPRLRAPSRRAIRTSASSVPLIMHARLSGLDLSSARGQGRDLEQT